MTIESIDINGIKPNPKNPRTIKDENFKKLVKSIQEFPEMLEVRPIVVDEEGVVLGGNMRLDACKKAGLKEVPIIRFENLTEEQKKEFVVKDNQGYGEWDFGALKEWSKDLLLDSGFEDYELLDIFGVNDMESKFTQAAEESNFSPEVIDVDRYIKQNVFFLNEFMLEFEDDTVKAATRRIKERNDEEAFLSDLKKLIMKYGEDTIR